MNIAILQQELNELKNIPTLYDVHNFGARKEALDFVAVIDRICSENSKGNNIEHVRLQQQAQELGEGICAFNKSVAHDWSVRLKNECPAFQELRAWLQPYTSYVPQQWGQPHYGYEDLDFLLDEIFLPKPHPSASLQLERGMARYELTPTSVILELMERIAFNDDDVFYDLGSGLGKATMFVHLLTGVRCVGVEYQPDFCAYAAHQARGLNLSDVRYLNSDARHVDYADATVFFFFNPFGETIFTTVLNRLQLEAQERELRICSYGSSSQLLSELPWLERIPPISENDAALAIFRTSKASHFETDLHDR